MFDKKIFITVLAAVVIAAIAVALIKSKTNLLSFDEENV